MKKWLVLVAVVLALMLGWLAAGPFLAINGIRTAVREQNAAKLSGHIDFPAVRTSLKQQFDDYLARRAGAEAQSSLLGAIGLQLASGASDGIVDALATPAGLAAIMEGRSLWKRLGGRRVAQDSGNAGAPPDPFENATYRYESLSRFTVTVPNADGDPVVFTLTRQGLAWKVTEVRVPYFAPPSGDGLSP